MSTFEPARRRHVRRALAVWAALWLAFGAWPVWASVDLTSFRAESNGQSITLIWETQSELDNLGFNVYRATRQTALFSDLAPNERTQINTDGIIPSKGGVDAHRYDREDPDVTPGITYYYWLEDLDNHGGAGHHGPLRAEVTSGAPVVLPTLTTPTATLTPTPASPTAAPVTPTSTPRPAEATRISTVAPTATNQPAAATNTPSPTASVAPAETTPPTEPSAATTSETVTPVVANTPLMDANPPAAPAETQAETDATGQPDTLASASTPDTIGTDVAVRPETDAVLPAPVNDPLTTPSRGVLIAIGGLALTALTIGGAAVIYLLRYRRTE